MYGLGHHQNFVLQWLPRWEKSCGLDVEQFGQVCGIKVPVSTKLLPDTGDQDAERVFGSHAVQVDTSLPCDSRFER